MQTLVCMSHDIASKDVLNILIGVGSQQRNGALTSDENDVLSLTLTSR